jgi:hypothetical protein
VQQDQPVNLEQQERLESLAQLERQDRPGRLEQQDHKVHQHQKNIKRWILGDILLAGVSPFFFGVSSLKLWRHAGPPQRHPHYFAVPLNAAVNTITFYLPVAS